MPNSGPLIERQTSLAGIKVRFVDVGFSPSPLGSSITRYEVPRPIRGHHKEERKARNKDDRWASIFRTRPGAEVPQNVGRRAEGQIARLP